MLPDVGFGELLIIVLVALAVVKPEEMPELMRKAGVFTASARNWLQSMLTGFQEGQGRSEVTDSSKHKKGRKANRKATRKKA